ncbi:hypothetical protein TrVFT333_010642 [Trichoderma virens FT-333]|nr:hypothetical protein TrVFT333_010642 [Trichoderma virens FT-333]
MLDGRHEDLEYPQNDPNPYSLGSIGPHNIVIVGLPLGKYGTNAAATVATQVTRTFPSIKVGLLVGIGGDIPPKWGLGKAEKNGKFKRTGALNNPPTALLTSLSKMKARVALEGSTINQHLDSMFTKYLKLGREYARPTATEDPLSLSDSDCSESRWHTMFYDTSSVISTAADIHKSESKEDLRDINVHYDLIASGNQVIKDAKERDRVDAE